LLLDKSLLGNPSLGTRAPLNSMTQTSSGFVEHALDDLARFSVLPSSGLLGLLWRVSLQTFVGMYERFLRRTFGFLSDGLRSLLWMILFPLCPNGPL
jgi:hypothetical protein